MFRVPGPAKEQDIPLQQKRPASDMPRLPQETTKALSVPHMQGPLPRFAKEKSIGRAGTSKEEFKFE